MQAIGLDIGTTSICGVRIDLGSGKVLQSVTLQSGADLQSALSYERIQDPAVILSKVRRILDELLLAGSAAAIGLSGQMHGILYLDKDGGAVSPLYTWQDGRGDLPFEDGTYASSFGAPSGYGLTTHFYNVRNGLVPASMATFCTIADFAAVAICGEKTPLLHASNAASLGQFDVKTMSFSVDVPFSVAADYALVGQYKSIPVAVAIGDNQAGFLGSAPGEGSLLVNVGTGSQVSFLSDTFPVAESIEARPCIEGKHLLAGCALCGGRAFAALERFFADISVLVSGRSPANLYKQMDVLLATVTETDLRMDTRFSGTRQNPALTGGISNLTLDNFTAADFMLASLQGIASELHSYYADMGVTAVRLIGSGNGIRNNPALQRIVSSVFGLPLAIPVHKEEASVGAALFALCASGACSDMAEAQGFLRYL